MTYTHILLRTGEIFLKGKNRSYFGRILLQNIQKMSKISVKKLRFRWITAYFEAHHHLQRIFGLTSYSPAVRVEKDITMIETKALELLHTKAGTFRVETNRADKSFPMASHEINVKIGQFIEQNSSLRFKVKEFDTLLSIEINQDGAYLFLETVVCLGGLPVGVEGKVAVLLEEEASLLAALLCMKRGCNIILLGFKKIDFSLVQKFTTASVQFIQVKDWTEIERYIQKENLSIVSGQSFSNFKSYSKNIVFRPLIAYTPERVTAELEHFKSL